MVTLTVIIVLRIHLLNLFPLYLIVGMKKLTEEQNSRESSEKKPPS